MGELPELPCDQLVELVTAYLEGALDPDTTARFEEHIGECAGCAAYLEQFGQVISLLGTLEPDRLSDRALTAMRRAFHDWAG